MKRGAKRKSMGETLKQLRKNANMTQKEAYESIHVPQSTFSSWERDIAEPDIETLIKLCRLYGVKDMLSAFGYDGYDESGDLDLNYWEDELIRIYRKLSTYNQETIRILAERMLEGVARTPERMVTRPLFDLPVSAGTGEFLDSDNYEMEEFPEERVPNESSFALRISGDSMQPDYPDGCVVFIEIAKDVSPGEVGVFILNGEGYIKLLGYDENLISLNKKYKPIPINKYDDFRIVGRVVGRYIDRI